MKKTVFMLIACAAMMASCNNGKTTATASQTDSVTTDSVMAQDSTVFEGITPAADCFGIRYRLALAADSTMGYSLTQDYMNSETEVKESFNNQGKFEQFEKDGKTYVKVVVSKEEVINLLKVDESTLRLVNDELQEPEATEGMNYDLKLVK